MGRIIFHAGMAKTGSSSIQRWLGDNLTDLQQARNIDVLRVARTSPRGSIDVVRAQPDALTSQLPEGLQAGVIPVPRLPSGSSRSWMLGQAAVIER